MRVSVEPLVELVLADRLVRVAVGQVHPDHEPVGGLAQRLAGEHREGDLERLRRARRRRAAGRTAPPSPAATGGGGARARRSPSRRPSRAGARPPRTPHCDRRLQIGRRAVEQRARQAGRVAVVDPHRTAPGRAGRRAPRPRRRRPAAAARAPSAGWRTRAPPGCRATATPATCARRSGLRCRARNASSRCALIGSATVPSVARRGAKQSSSCRSAAFMNFSSSSAEPIVPIGTCQEAAVTRRPAGRTAGSATQTSAPPSARLAHVRGCRRAPRRSCARSRARGRRRRRPAGRVGAGEALERAVDEAPPASRGRGRRRAARPSRRRSAAARPTSPSPWRSALSTRFPSACSSRIRSPRSDRSGPGAGASRPARSPAPATRTGSPSTRAGRPRRAARAAAPGGRRSTAPSAAGPRRAGRAGRPRRAAPHRLAQLVGRSAWRSASSSSVRRSASGVRSSCPASATNPRSRSMPGLEPREHRVQRLAEALDLVARLRAPAAARPASPPRSTPPAGASSRPGAARGRRGCSPPAWPGRARSGRRPGARRAGRRSVSVRFSRVAPTTRTSRRPLRTTGVARSRDGSFRPGSAAHVREDRAAPGAAARPA